MDQKSLRWFAAVSVKIPHPNLPGFWCPTVGVVCVRTVTAGAGAAATGPGAAVLMVVGVATDKSTAGVCGAAITGEMAARATAPVAIVPSAIFASVFIATS